MFVFSLVTIYLLIGSFYLFIFVIVPLLVVLPLLYQLLMVFLSRRKAIINIRESTYSLTFSLLNALIAAIVLPYLIFNNSLTSIYVVQYLYVFPVILIFFVSLCFFSSLMLNTELSFKKILYKPLALSLIISVLLTAILIVSFNNLYDDSLSNYNEEFVNTLDELNYVALYGDGIEVFNDINNYTALFVIRITRLHTVVNANSARVGVYCSPLQCLKLIKDINYFIIDMAFNSFIIKEVSKEANDVLEYINSGEYKKNFSSLDEYEFYLKNKLSESGIDGFFNTDRANKTIYLTSEATYEDLERFINVKGFNVDFFDDSVLLGRSMNYAIRHSFMFEQSVLFADMIQTNILDSPFLLLSRLYQKMDAEESTVSKVIRYSILLNYVERRSVHS